MMDWYLFDYPFWQIHPTLIIPSNKNYLEKNVDTFKQNKFANFECIDNKILPITVILHNYFVI